jgi:GGDEF domain-containing protein
VSIGVAVYPENGKTMEGLLRTADRQLYGMKNQQEERAPLQFAAAASSCRRGGFNERQD